MERGLLSRWLATPRAKPVALDLEPDHLQPASERNDVGRLMAAYAVERQDDASALALGFSMATAGFTYMIAAALFLMKQCDGKGCGNAAWAQLLAPAIPVAVLGFIALTTSATVLRSVHMQTLEAELGKAVSQVDGKPPPYTPHFHTDAGIIWRPDHLKDPPRVRRVFAAVNGAVYAIVYGSVIGFTIVVLLPGAWFPWKVVALSLYIAIELLELGCLLITIVHPIFKFAPTNAKCGPSIGS